MALNAVAFHKGGLRLASAGQDNTVRLWDLITGQEILELQVPVGPVRAVAVSSAVATAPWRDTTGSATPTACARAVVTMSVTVLVTSTADQLRESPPTGPAKRGF